MVNLAEVIANKTAEIEAAGLFGWKIRTEWAGSICEVCYRPIVQVFSGNTPRWKHVSKNVKHEPVLRCLSVLNPT